MFCKNCGKEIDNDSKFCQFCGTKICIDNNNIKEVNIQKNNNNQIREIEIKEKSDRIIERVDKTFNFAILCWKIFCYFGGIISVIIILIIGIAMFS